MSDFDLDPDDGAPERFLGNCNRRRSIIRVIDRNAIIDASRAGKCQRTTPSRDQASQPG
jgi:hypothetical protein